MATGDTAWIAICADRTARGIRRQAAEFKAQNETLKHSTDYSIVETIVLTAESRALDWEQFAKHLRSAD